MPYSTCPATHLCRRQLLLQQLDLSRQLSLVAAVRGARLAGTALADTPAGARCWRCPRVALHLQPGCPLLCLANSVLQHLHTRLGGGGALLGAGQLVTQLADLQA